MENYQYIKIILFSANNFEHNTDIRLKRRARESFFNTNNKLITGMNFFPGIKEIKSGYWLFSFGALTVPLMAAT